MTAIYRTTLHGTQYGQTVDITHGWTGPGVGNSSDAHTLAQRVYDGWLLKFLPDLSDTYELLGCTAVSIDVPTAYGIVTFTQPGADAGAPAPAFVVGNVSLATGLRGRSYQGRFGIPGLLESMTDATNGNQLTSAAVTTLQTDTDDFFTYVATGVPAFFAGVISTISGGTPRATPISTPVTSWTVRSTLGSRVSRKG